MSTPDEPITEVHLVDLEPDVPRRCLLSFELLGGLEEGPAEALYHQGPEGVRAVGARLAEAFSDAAEFMEAAQRIGWGQHEPVESAVGVELLRTMLPRVAASDFASLPGCQNSRARLWTEVGNGYVPVAKE